MNVFIQLAVPLLNALGVLLRELPGLIAAMRGNADLTPEGAALLERLDSRIAEHERRLEATQPLPVPKPTAR